MKETKTKKGSSGLPVVIIVLVLVVVVAGAFLFYRQQSKPTPKSNSANTTNTSAANQKPQTLDMANAPSGAQPPNMLGSPTATVKLEEFADFQCGSCGAAYPVIKDTLSAY